jgi:hypothetical protein
MVTPNEKLAASLAQLRELQQGGRRVFQSKELSRINRERLLRGGFVREVMKGWLISSSPTADPADTTPWFASFWEFCARYCQERFDDRWHLSPEQSLLLHAEDTVIPPQVTIYAPAGKNNTIQLLFGSSLYDLKQSLMPPSTDLSARDGLRLYDPEAALIRVSESFFAQKPLEAQIVLARIRDASGLLRRLLDGGHSAIAGRLAGAFRAVGRPELADEILRAMKAASYDVREVDPFETRQTLARIERGAAPIVTRIQAMWNSLRDPVLKDFPFEPGLPKNKKGYLRFVDEMYQSDAYHSLSIEGYSVTPELIDRVRSGNWNPDHHADDRQSRDALAARGYWQAFQLVKAAVSDAISGANAGSVVRTAHQDWYRELFQPCVSAGLIAPSALAGYRNHAVFIRGSRHVPPRWEAVRDAMPAFFDLLAEEREPAVRAVLGHWLFGYIHPYPDGNGRIARLLMNTMLASGGYPWTVIRVEDRTKYMSALEAASVDLDIEPFTKFLGERVKWSIDQSGEKASERA